MRVALVHRNFNLGGSLERSVALLARELSSTGVEVHCYSNPGTRTLELPGITFHDVAPLVVSRSRFGYAAEWGSFAVAATRALRRDRALYDIVAVCGAGAWEHDVVTVHGVTRALQHRWPGEAGRNYRLPVLRARLAPLTGPRLAVARAIESLQFRPGRYRRVIAVTEQVREDLVEVHRVPRDLIDVIPPPIDLRRLVGPDGNGARLRDRLGLGAEPVLLFVGHSFERKGLAEAIRALDGLHPLAHLVVVGAGKEQRYRALADRLGVGRRVHFAGPTDSPDEFYRGADVFVLPARGEPWGIPLVEAMAAGVPVVTSAVAGAARVVEEAGAGLVLTDCSDECLREALATLLRDPAHRRAMGERGRAAAESFSAESVAAATIETYRRVQEERRRPVRRRAREAVSRQRWGIAAFPWLRKGNPYQRLLYGSLAEHGFDAVPDAAFKLLWLVRSRRNTAYLHFHWPESQYTLGRGPRPLRGPLSWAKLVLFAVRLAAARALGYRLAWTIHQVYPHERRSRLRDRAAARLLAAAAHVLIAHDAFTREQARSELGRAGRRVHVVPHGSYVGVYPPGRDRSAVRAGLGIPRCAFAFLVFGELRGYKNVDLAAEAFSAAALPSAALVVAGFPKDPAIAEALRRRAEGDPRIRLRLEVVPDAEVAELFAACDAAVIPRRDGGTSGSLILALSMGVPVVAADRPAYRELLGDPPAGWLFDPADPGSLRAALEAAASDPAAAQAKGLEARARVGGLRWPEIAARTARLLAGAVE